MEAILKNLMDFFTERVDLKDDYNYKKNLIPICILAKKLLNNNMLQENLIVDQFVILGNDRGNYLQSFLDDFYNYKFKNKTFIEVLKLMLILPEFAENSSLSSQFKLQYSQHLSNITSKDTYNEVYSDIRSIFIKKKYNDTYFSKKLEVYIQENCETLSDTLRYMMTSLYQVYSQNQLYNLASVISGNELSLANKDIENQLFILLSQQLRNKVELKSKMSRE